MAHVRTDRGSGESPHAAGRYYSLDVLRGLGAMSVVFWHWQHFYFDRGVLDPTYWASPKPFESVLGPLYVYGAMAVDLFFALSGFIFFRLYAGPIGSRAVTGDKFFVLRFSRLYPLHICTLVLVVLLQQIHIARYGANFVWQNDDALHLLLNLLLLNGIILKTQYSFNVPSWSISVEALLYVAFFWSQRARLSGLWQVATIAVAGYLFQKVNLDIGRGLWGFFGGGFLALLSARIEAEGWTRPVLMASAAATLASFVLMFLLVTSLPIKPAALDHLLRLTHFTDKKIVQRCFLLLTVPSLLMTLVLAEEKFGHISRHLSTLGDVSYSIYLIHFPLQIAAVLLLGHDPAIYRSDIFFLAFWAALFVLGWLSYHYLEMPAQKKLRTLLGRRKSPIADRTIAAPAVAEGEAR